MINYRKTDFHHFLMTNGSKDASIMMGMGMALVPPTSGEKGVKSCKL